MSTPKQVEVCSLQWLPRIGSISGRVILNEASGALGDLGTFVPIVIALTLFVGMDAATILVFAGLANIVTGLVFRVPIAVQPMKAIAALAIAGAMTADQVSSAGFLIGACMLALACLGLIERLDRIIPHAVIGGIQLIVGAKLAIKGLNLGLIDPVTHVLRPLWGAESLTVLGVAAVVLLWSRGRWRRAALGLIGLGFVIAVVKEPTLLSSWDITLWRPAVISLDPSALGAILRGSLVQIPLTLLNSVFAVSVLAGRLFSTGARQVAPTKVAVSVGLMNLLTCPFGAMPVCHGSGGLAGQYAFGARSGLSMVMLGTAKLLAGLLFGAVALTWMQAFPLTVLSMFLLLAGVTLAQASRFWQTWNNIIVAVVTMGISFATGCIPVGFVAGWFTHVLLTRVIQGEPQMRPSLLLGLAFWRKGDDA